MESVVKTKLIDIQDKLLEKYPKLEQYKGSNVLLTGGTGFKGSWLKNFLLILGAKVENIDINSISSVGDFSTIYYGQSKTHCLDIACNETLEFLKTKSYDFIFHLAAQPLVIPSVDHPAFTWRTNVMGTINALEIARKREKPPVCIIVTSDKVYKNTGLIGDKLSEESVLGGLDPYSSSKSACELAVASWNHTFNKDQSLRIATVRGGNVIGGGDYSAFRLIPDIYNAYATDTTLIIRSPLATRPWQHVIDSSLAYLLFGSSIAEANTSDYPSSLNIGPTQSTPISVNEVCKIAQEQLPGFHFKSQIDHCEEKNIEHLYLSLDTSLMKNYLKFEPTLNPRMSISHTLNWYHNVHHNKNDRISASVHAIDCYLNM